MTIVGVYCYRWVDPAEDLEWVLFYTGVVKAFGRGRSVVYPFMVVLANLDVLFSGLATWVYTFENHPFDDKIEAIQCGISFVHLLAKIINLRTRRATFWALVDDSRRMWRELASSEENRGILEEQLLFVKKTQRVITVLALWPVPLSIMLTIFRNMSSESGERELVYKVWDPIRDSLGEDWYWSRCTFQVVVIFYALFLFVAVYCAILIPSLLASAFMQVLNRHLEAERVDVRACITLHQRILKLIADINGLFAGQMFLDMILSAVYISFRSYQLIQMVNNNDPRAFGTIFFLSVCFGAPFIVCLSGHIINDMSEKVYRSSYFGHWYDLNLKERKAMCFLMGRAADVPTLQYRSFMKFDMVQYGSMVQATYSYITLLTGK